jgi:hypothetical protein
MGSVGRGNVGRRNIYMRIQRHPMHLISRLSGIVLISVNIAHVTCMPDSSLFWVGLSWVTCADSRNSGPRWSVCLQAYVDTN